MLFLLFLIINADDSCDARTNIYNLHGYFNLNSYYFDSRTYTESDNSMTSRAYKDYIKSTVLCTGQWCIDKQWECYTGNSKDCYNVEHIIPKGNTILEIYGCSTDIQGNLIMAYGAWNQQLSDSYYGEKAAIYGSSIFKSAYNSVYVACHGSNPSYYPDELCLSNISGIKIILILFMIISTLIIFIAILYYVKYETKILVNEITDINEDHPMDIINSDDIVYSKIKSSSF